MLEPQPELRRALSTSTALVTAICTCPMRTCSATHVRRNFIVQACVRWRPSWRHLGDAHCPRLRVATKSSSSSVAGGVVVDEHGRSPLISAGHLPLLNRRVMVTAPRQYAQKLCGKLINAGARVLWVPGVQITEINDAQGLFELDQALWPVLEPSPGRPAYSHIAFTSKNGIFATVQRLVHLAGGLSEVVEAINDSNIQLCALGADGQVLECLGLPVHVSPTEASTQGLVKELVNRGEVLGARVLCPVPRVTDGLTEPPVVPRFLDALEREGAYAIRADAYITSPGSKAVDAKPEAELLQDGYIHAIVFSSTAEAQGLISALGGRNVVTESVERHSVMLAAHGPYTAAGASQVLGLPIECVSNDFRTFDGLVAALEDAFRRRASGK